MKIWLINPGEPLPIDKSQRLLRTGKLAYELKKDHEIIWFSSKFDHFSKSFRDKNQQEFEGIKYIFINSIGYNNNLSFKRILDHFILGINLILKAFTLKKPDLVITSYPPIETSFFIMLFCKLKKIKIICDVRDLWPYTFPHLFKKKFYKFLCNIAIYPWVFFSKITFKYTKLITISDGFKLWLNNKTKKPVDSIFLSYEKKKIEKVDGKFKDLNLTDNDFIICFIGNYSKVKFNFEFLINSSEDILRISRNIKFVLCGEISNLDKKYNRKFENIFFYNWINKNEVRKLLSISKAGLAPYNDLWDFNLSIPNKISEYLCYELPVISSLKGDSFELIEKYNCGINYDVENKKLFLESLKNLYENHNFYNQLKKGAIEASKNFDDEKVMHKMKEIIFN